MSAYIKIPSFNLRDKLADIFKPRYAELPIQTWFTGDGTTTTFSVDSGLKISLVFDGGSIQKEDTDYSVSASNNVVFTTAPVNLNDICVVSYKELS